MISTLVTQGPQACFLTGETEPLIACPTLSMAVTYTNPRAGDIEVAEYSPSMHETLDSIAGIRGKRSEVQAHPGYIEILRPDSDTLSKKK